MNPEFQSKVLSIAEHRLDHIRGLATRPSGLGWCAEHSDMVDATVHLIYDGLRHDFGEIPPFAVIATGGYGRREMAPYSDIDITVVPSDEASPILDQAIRKLFQDLHWAFCTVFRLDVGYAYRLISDAPGLDAKTRTGLMDMRHIAGSYDLVRQLEAELRETLTPGEFILSKISERREMFAKHHDTPYIAEPHLKEGAGGVRCMHSSNWIRNAIGEQPTRPSKAFDTVVRFRNLLHMRAGKHQDFLSRQRQSEIADLLGLDAIAMMADLVAGASELHADYIRATEKLSESRFTLAYSVLSVQGEARVVGSADAGEAAVGIAIATKLGLRVSDLPVGPMPTMHGPAALFALSSGERTIRNLDRCGLLDIVLPQLTATRNMVPDDSVHMFTVFEHTLRVVRNIDSLQPGSFLGDLKVGVNDLEPLYLATLLHDVGKVDLDQSHSELGAMMARDLAHSWGLAEDVVEIVEFLIREHLTMARFIRVRDLANPETTVEFAGIVKDTNRLKLLTILTWADVSAVNTSAWTPAQDTFLRELHDRTLEHLQNDDTALPDPALYRQRLLRQLKSQDTDEARIQRFVESLPSYYLTSTPPEVIRLQMGFAERAIEGTPSVEVFQRHDLDATEITVCTLDAPRLLTRMLGVFYAYELNVSGIRASTTTTFPPVALDVFTVSFGNRPIPSSTLKQVSASLMDVLEGRLEVEHFLTKKGKDPFRIQRISTYTYVEGTPGVLEISAPRGRGMPYRFSRQIADQGWNVVSARVGQWAGSAAAAFYILGPNGTTLSSDEVSVVMAQE
jgi:[protein-PII] uridylyltransferase